jgi:hypothetical protein
MLTIEDDKIVSFQELLAGPLIATIYADFTASQRFLELILEYGLEEVSDENSPVFLDQQVTDQPLGCLKMVTFWYNQTNYNTGENDYIRVQIPLLSLIPLPLLQIQQANFDFNIRIFSEVEYQNNLAGKKNALKKGIEAVKKENETGEIGKFKGFKARLSPSVGRSADGKTTSSIDANMKVAVQIKQADLPVGIASLMALFNNIASVTQHSPNRKPDQSETISLGEPPPEASASAC